MKILNIALAIIFIGISNKVCCQKTEAQLLQYLQTYRGGTSTNVYPCSFIPNINITDSVKRRLLELLKNQWTNEELKPIVNGIFKEEFDYMYFEDIITMANSSSKSVFFNKFQSVLLNSKKDTLLTFSNQYQLIYDSIFKKVYDSTASLYRNQIERKIKEKPVSNELVKLAANIGLKEAIPLLKADLASIGHHLYNPEMAELALAKLGDKVLYKKILKECSYNNLLSDYDSVSNYETNNWTKDYERKSAKLFFLATQESLFMINYWMDTSKISIVGQVNSDITVGYSSHSIMYPILIMFGQFDLMKEYRRRAPAKSPQTAEAVLSFKKWLIENKGKYKLNQPCPN